MAVYVLLSVGVGILAGYAALPPSAAAFLDETVTWLLAFLVFVVGVDIGRNRAALQRVRAMGVKVLLVPLSIAVGTLAGAAAAAPLLGMAVKETMAVGAGFGWYSLSGVLIAGIYNIELGTLAFLTNVVRELIAFISIPFLVGVVGRLPSIAPGGAATMDSVLPLITRVTDSQTALIAFVNGLCLSGLVPLLIPMILGGK